MSKRKIAYARKNVIDAEEEGETLPFEPRQITIHTDYWIDRDYELHDVVLGRGKFGEVKRCHEISTGLVLAAKIVTTRKQKEKDDVRKEIEIMSQLHHPKILQIYDAFQSAKKMCIITEIVEGGELFDRVVDENFDLTERVAILFMRQIIDGMAFIHANNILHLDMKPENIVCVAKTGTRVKIIDFGLAAKYNSFSTTKVLAGTVDFMSPEVCNYESVTPATDMWSIGVICYVLVSGLSPFCGDDDANTICNILHVDFDFAAEEFDDITAGCKDFIKKLLVKDPRARMTAVECMKHSWLNKITRSQTNKHLSKKHHIKFFVKRKWKKVIKAVIALNRMSRLARERKNASQSNASGPPPSAAAEPIQIPDWTVSMAERISQGQAKAKRISSKTSSNLVRSGSNVVSESASSGPITSFSSGYNSSGSMRSTATLDDLPLVADREECVDETVTFERLPSVDALTNDETGTTTIEPTDVDANHVDVADLQTVETSVCIAANQDGSTDQNVCLAMAEEQERSSNPDVETFDLGSDTESEKQYYSPGNTDNLSMEMANEFPEQSETDSSDSPEDIRQSSELLPNYVKDSLPEDCKSFSDVEPTDLENHKSYSQTKPLEYSGLQKIVTDELVADQTVRQMSPEKEMEQNKSTNHEDSTRPVDEEPLVIRKYDRHRQSSSLGAEGCPRGSNHSIRSGRRAFSPSTRCSRSSRNSSREPSIDQDLDDFTPVYRKHRWSPSPGRQIETTTLQGNEFIPTSVTYGHDLQERIIPIEVEQSPPPDQRAYKFSPRRLSISSNHSDSLGSLYSALPDYDVYSNEPTDVHSLYRVCDSPIRHSPTFTSRARDSPSSIGSNEARRLRIAAIVGRSSESIDSAGGRKPPPAISSNYSDVDPRQARIAAIIDGSSGAAEGQQKRAMSAGNSRSSSRTDSDEARHRRIAAILSKADNS